MSDKLTRGERAADGMKRALATWPALIGVLVFIGAWMVTDGVGIDKSPWIMLNLMLSCFAALQCFVLLIAGKRGEQAAERLAQATHANTIALKELLERTETENLQIIEQEQRIIHDLEDHS